MRAWRVALLVGLLVAGAIVARATPVGAELGRVAAWLGRAGDHPWAPPLYVLVYAAAIAVGLPGSLMTIVGAATFGFVKGFGVNFCGALLGASAAFFLARRIGGFQMKHHKLPDLADPRAAFWTFVRLRLLPVVPFNGLNYAAALTRTRFLPFLAGTAVGIVPSTLIYSFLAHALAQGGRERAAAAEELAVALAALTVLSLAPTLWKWLFGRRADVTRS